MCHQTVGLVARQLEESGIPTVTMTSARDITLAVNPARAVFLDYPLGHTAGQVDDPSLGRQIVAGALQAFADADHPGWIRDQPFRWAENDSWKDDVLRPSRPVESDGAESADDRSPRVDTPQYQLVDDAFAAQQSHSGQQRLVRKGVDY